MRDATQHRTVYRSITTAAIYPVVGALLAAPSIALLISSPPGVVDGVEVAIGLALSLLAIFRLGRCGIYVEPDGIRVLNPLSSTRVRWDEIRRFVLPDRGACRIQRHGASAVKVFGIQPATWATLRRMCHTRESAMVDELNRRLANRRLTS